MLVHKNTYNHKSYPVSIIFVKVKVLWYTKIYFQYQTQEFKHLTQLSQSINYPNQTKKF